MRLSARRAWRIGARVVAYAMAALLVVALGLVLALRTQLGKRALLRVALPLVNARIAGHVSVRGIDGDLWDRVVLFDARLDDAEGVEAIYARRIEARLDARALWHRRVHFASVVVDGARLTLRHLADNRFNLAALGKPAPARADRAHKRAPERPLVVDIDRFHVQVDGAYHPPRGHEANPVDWPRGAFDVTGALHVTDGNVHIAVERLVSDARDPLHAHVELRGGLAVTPNAADGGRNEFTLEDVAVSVVSDGDEIARLHPALHPRGRWAVHAEGGGPLARLEAHAIVSAPRGSVTIDGTLARLFPGVRWSARVVGAGLDPAADWRALPAGRVDFAVAGSGAGKRGTIVVERLAGAGDGVRVEARGQSDFAGRGHGVVRASIESLARLGDLGLRLRGVDELDGRVRLSARLVGDAAGPRVDGHVRADGLWLRHGRAKVKARVVELDGRGALKRPLHVAVAARDLEIAGVAIARRAQPFTLRVGSLQLALDGRPRRFSVQASGALADGTRARIGGRAAVGAHAVDAIVSSLAIEGARRRFALAEPARVRLWGPEAAPHFIIALAGARLDGRVYFGHRRLLADASLAAPDLSRVAELGGVGLGGAARARLHLQLARQLTLDATVDGERLRGPLLSAARLHATVHTVDLVGDARVDADELRAGGVALAHLSLHAHGTRERLAVTLDGTRAGTPSAAARLRLALDGRWRTAGLRVVRGDLWLRTAELTLPRQRWQLVAPAHVAIARGAVTLDGMRVRSGVGELDIAGRWTPPAIDVTLALENGDLEELSRAAGRPGLLPAARWSGRVHVAGTWLAPVVDARLEARAARTVAWLGLGVNAMSLALHGDAHAATLHADARGRGDTRVIVDAHGAPRRDAAGKFAAIGATLDRVQFSVHGHTWQLRQPCRVDVAARVTVDGCRLGAPGRGEIALTGAAPIAPGGGALDVLVTTRHLDLRDLHALLAPGHREPPKTDFAIRAHVTGTRRAPVIDMQLAGRGQQIDEGGLPENVDYRITAHWGEGRVRGQASMRQHGMRLGIGATFDLPTKLARGQEQPIALELEARPVPFYKIRNLLPTVIANLKGFFTLRVSASGTTRHPRVSAELHMPSWGLDDLHDNNTIVDLAYDGRVLVLNSVTSFEAQSLVGAILRLHPPRNSGTVTMELRAPVDVVRMLEAPHDALHALVHDAPIVASAEIRNVDLHKVPMQTLGFDAPLTGGRINAAVRAGGTLHQPSLHAEFRALGLRRTGTIDHLDLDGALAWEHGRVQVSGKAALRGAPLFTYRGVAALDGRRLFDGDHWRDGALAFDVDVPDYPLARLRDLQPRLHVIDGHLRARAELRGTFGDPDLRIVGAARDVGLAHARFARLDGNVRLHDDRWTFDVGGDEAAGGTLRAAGELPRDWDQPMQLSADARALDVGFLGALWEEIGDVGGRLDAHVDVTGTRAAPRPVGWARLDGGRFSFRGDAARYQGALDLAISGDEARLSRLTLRAPDGGTLEATGRATLAGLLPTRLSLSARAHAFNVAYGSAAARFDADFQIAGDRKDDVFHGALELSRGSIVLPDLGGLAAVDELAGSNDVRFDDSRSRKSAGQRAAGKGAFIVMHVDGPLLLRSKEADLDLAGELGVTIAGGALSIEGVVEAEGGTVELLGKRYEVERAQMAFGGPPDDPELHLRVTRRIGKATVAVVIEGTAKNPEVRLSCEPPVYDEAQLTSLILAGGATHERLAIRDLHRQISGLLSAVVIRKIQHELAPSLAVDIARPLDQQSYAEFSAAPIEVGRFVSDRIYVRYQQRYGGSQIGRSAANAEEASAEYQLGKGFQLTTTFGDAGVGGVYLFWTAKH